MLPYLILAMIPLIACSIYKKSTILKYAGIENVLKEKREKRYLIISGVAIFLFMALRSRYIGSTDTQGYCYLMNKAILSPDWKTFYDPEGVEKGFQIFTFALSRVFKDAQWLIVISSAIYTVSILYFIRHNSDDVIMSLVMYITLDLMRFQMQGMRQSIAMCICIFAYEFAKNKKPIRFFLLVALATQMHRTAIVFVVVYFIRRFKFKAIHMMIFMALSVALFSVSDSLVSTANEIFDTSYTSRVSSGGFVSVAIYGLIILVTILCNKKLKKDDTTVMLFYITLLGATCYLMRYFGTLIAERISFYFVFAQVALLPNTLGQLSKDERPLIKILVYGLMIALCAYRLNGSNMIPYEFFWEVDVPAYNPYYFSQ